MLAKKSRPPSLVKVRRLQRQLLVWFSRSGRDLPWRRTRNPYAIAVSEVMLQQTQVVRVVPKYLSWMKKFPSTKSLARASLPSILVAWSGLGYNNRAFRLREMARRIESDYSGRFPVSRTELETLPGFGNYTSGAVATFAFGRREGIVDTNIRRVLGRLFLGVRSPYPEQQINELALRLLPEKNADRWNHALMDLGAMVCTQQKPKCHTCPLQQQCRSFPKILHDPFRRLHPKPERFQGSNRQLRGQIIRLLNSEQPLTMAALTKRLHRPLSSIQQALQGLQKDGVIAVRSNRFSISR